MPPLAKYYLLFVPGAVLTSAFPFPIMLMGLAGWLVLAAGIIALFASFAIRCPGCSHRIVALPPDDRSWKVCDTPQRRCRFCGRDLWRKNERRIGLYHRSTDASQ
jgi:hypothetical protein